MKTLIQQVKGTREFYPSQMEIRRWLYSKIEEVSIRYGYQEYDGPFLEKIELYAAKSGEELVKEQAFVFPDRGGDLITLRPELTPSLARMVAEKQNELVYPIRWWSFGPFWRYERPQKGRTREFFQWNIDLIGADSPEADAELVAICASFLRTIGITPDQVKILVNHRKLVDQELFALGIESDLKKEVFHLIDRHEKMKKEDWESSAKEMGLTQQQIVGVVEIMQDKELWRKSPELIRVFSALESLGVSEYVAYDPKIIRGLDYYTGIVFEAWDVGGDGRAALGGGHYDNLVGDVGGKPLAGVGFAMGDVMITLLLEKYNKLPVSSQYKDCVLVTVFDESLLTSSLTFAAELRKNGIKTIFYPEIAKLQKQLKFADRLGIHTAIVIGPDEENLGNLAIKDLPHGTQEVVKRSEAIDKIKHLLAQQSRV
ncbi:MAG: histidyl-tRNA synthetase [Chloroflexi bacterium]|nr:MAG: histidyl-tRNA synthetase [Chloroflexota bacterium]